MPEEIVLRIPYATGVVLLDRLERLATMDREKAGHLSVVSLDLLTVRQQLEAYMAERRWRILSDPAATAAKQSRDLPPAA